MKISTVNELHFSKEISGVLVINSYSTDCSFPVEDFYVFLQLCFHRKNIYVLYQYT